MNTQVSKKLALGAALIVATLAMSSAHADERRVWMRFAGALLQNVEQTEVTVDGSTVPATKNAVHVRAWGNLGRAEITGFGYDVPVAPAPDPAACPDGFFKVAEIVENNLVLTFADLSLLYGEGSGAICVNFATGDVFTPIDGHWTGGTQRFRNAGGDWSIRFDEAVPVGDAASMLAETGVIVGQLAGPRDDD